MGNDMQKGKEPEEHRVKLGLGDRRSIARRKLGLDHAGKILAKLGHTYVVDRGPVVSVPPLGARTMETVERIVLFPGREDPPKELAERVPHHVHPTTPRLQLFRPLPVPNLLDNSAQCLSCRRYLLCPPVSLSDRPSVRVRQRAAKHDTKVLCREKCAHRSVLSAASTPA